MKRNLLLAGLILALVCCFSGGALAATGYETTGPELSFDRAPGTYNAYVNTGFYTEVRVNGDVGMGAYYLITKTGTDDLTAEDTGNYDGDYTTFDSAAMGNSWWDFDNETNEYVIHISMNVADEDTWVALLYVDVNGNYAITDPWQITAIDFSDVPNMTWYKEALVMSVNYGIVQGYGNDIFKPQSQVTRAEFAQMLYNLLNVSFIDEQPAPVGVLSATDDSDVILPHAAFSDVKDGDWYYKAVIYLAQRGYLNGYKDGTFLPNGYITRAEIAQVLYNIAISSDTFKQSLNGGEQSYFIDVPLNAWYYAAVATLADAGWVKGYANVQVTTADSDNPMESHPYFQPQNTATRAEALQFATRLIYGNNSYQPNQQPTALTFDFVAIH